MSRLTPLRTSIEQEAQILPDFASILIVDDQRFDRMRLKRLCANLDFTTHIAEADTLAAMLDRLDKDRFDLILLDHNLPDGNGLQGVEMIRANHTNRQAATVMITGVDDTDIAVQALKSGFSDYMTKDELSAPALRRAAINAIQKSRLSTGMKLQGAHRTQLQQSLRRFSRECAQEIKPIVSRMMRQMRELRDVERLSPTQAAEKVEHIETSCQRLWEFLDDLDAYSGDDLLAEDTMPVAAQVPLNPSPDGATASNTLTGAQSLRSVKKPGPPSVFGSRPR